MCQPVASGERPPILEANMFSGFFCLIRPRSGWPFGIWANVKYELCSYAFFHGSKSSGGRQKFLVVFDAIKPARINSSAPKCSFTQIPRTTSSKGNKISYIKTPPPHGPAQQQFGQRHKNGGRKWLMGAGNRGEAGDGADGHNPPPLAPLLLLPSSGFQSTRVREK